MSSPLLARLASRLRSPTASLAQNRRGREGAIDGLNLFFGALLGANLGTLDRIRLVDYVQLIVLLAGTVITLRIISTAGRRTSMMILLAAYALLLIALVVVPGIAPRNLDPADLHRLVATLAIWVFIGLGIEFSPLFREPENLGERE